MEALGFDLQREAVLSTLVGDVVKSSDIEGEIIGTVPVRSSVARRLGMDAGGMRRADRDVEGVVEMTLDATQHYDQPLTAERLYGWHSSLFPTGRSGMKRIRVGAWRDRDSDPMQVVSGPVGRERVHFEAPVAARLDAEMKTFLDWFEAPAETDAVLKAGLTHLWFVTIHPFEDGNGRIARAVADMALARSEHRLPALLQHVVADLAERLYPDGQLALLDGQRSCGTKMSRAGISTAGSVVAFIASSAPMRPFSARIQATRP